MSAIAAPGFTRRLAELSAARSLARDDRPFASANAGGATFAAAIFGGYALAYAMLELGRLP